MTTLFPTSFVRDGFLRSLAPGLSSWVDLAYQTPTGPNAGGSHSLRQVANLTKRTWFGQATDGGSVRVPRHVIEEEGTCCESCLFLLAYGQEDENDPDHADRFVSYLDIMFGDGCISHVSLGWGTKPEPEGDLEGSERCLCCGDRRYGSRSPVTLWRHNVQQG